MTYAFTSPRPTASQALVSRGGNDVTQVDHLEFVENKQYWFLTLVISNLRRFRSRSTQEGVCSQRVPMNVSLVFTRYNYTENLHPRSKFQYYQYYILLFQEEIIR